MGEAECLLSLPGTQVDVPAVELTLAACFVLSLAVHVANVMVELTAGHVVCVCVLEMKETLQEKWLVC